MPWSEAQDATILRLQSEGYSASETGKAVGVTRNAVIGRLYRLRAHGQGLPARVHPPRQEPKPKPAKAPRFPKDKPVKPVMRTAAENIGPPPTAKAERKPWREAMLEAFSPLPGSQPVLWSQRGRAACAWPVGGDGEGLISCAMPTDGRSYCSHHHALAYVQTKRPGPLKYGKFA
jgi:hypothetical protein